MFFKVFMIFTGLECTSALTHVRKNFVKLSYELKTNQRGENVFEQFDKFRSFVLCVTFDESDERSQTPSNYHLVSLQNRLGIGVIACTTISNF